MKKIIITVVILAINYASNAQPVTTWGFDDDPQNVTIYGGISLIAFAILAYGYKKFDKKG